MHKKMNLAVGKGKKYPTVWSDEVKTVQRAKEPGGNTLGNVNGSNSVYCISNLASHLMSSMIKP